MEVLQQFKHVVADFADVADFVIVYTAEAHPVEGWRIKVRLTSILFPTDEFLHPAFHHPVFVHDHVYVKYTQVKINISYR